jgi:hypothetical protein
MISSLFSKQKPKEPKPQVSQREKKQIHDKAMKDAQKQKRKVLSTEINPYKEQSGPKQEKEHFSEVEVISFQADPLKTFQNRIEHYKGNDEQIIFDEQFLLDDEDDPDKVYQELKKKQQRRMKMENQEKDLSENIKKGNQELSEENEAFIKIRDYLKRSPAADRLDFTQNLLKMAQELGKQLTINGILPSFKILSGDNENIKMALIDQVTPIATFLIGTPESDEYKH